MKIEIIEKQLDLPLNPSEMEQLSHQIKKYQDQVDSMLSQLMSGLSKKSVKVVKQIDEELGLITEFYDGKIISTAPIRSKTTQQLPQQQIPEAKSIEVQQETHEESLIGEEEVADGPVFELDSDPLGLFL